MPPVWMTYKGINLYRANGQSAYVYSTAHMEIDADGAPNACNHANTGLDDYANANYPHGNWQDILVRDPTDPAQAFVQKGGTYAGYFVSMTTLTDPALPSTNPAKYVDAATVPYIVFPGDFIRLAGTGNLGDLAIAKCIATGKEAPAIIADVGPHDAPLGEISIALAKALGAPNPSARHGVNPPLGLIRYVIFPKSHFDPKKWPVTSDQITTEAQALLAAAGGWPAVDGLFV